MLYRNYPKLPNFSNNRICIKLSKFFFIVSVYQDGIKIKKTNGKYILENDLGEKKEMILKRGFLEPIPYILLDEQSISINSPLNIFDKVLVLLPILTFVLGGINIVTLVSFVLSINITFYLIYKTKDLFKKLLVVMFTNFLFSSLTLYIEILILNYLRSLS